MEFKFMCQNINGRIGQKNTVTLKCSERPPHLKIAVPDDTKTKSCKYASNGLNQLHGQQLRYILLYALAKQFVLTRLHSERPKLHRVNKG